MKHTGKETLLYQKIASILEKQILQEVLNVGDKLPSIRMICRQHGVSMSTAQCAFHELEKKSLIESRPQSGYYVSNTFKRKLGVPANSKPAAKNSLQTETDLFEAIFSNTNEEHFTVFSRGIPAISLLPIAKLNKATIQAVRELPGGGTMYEPLQGNHKLKKQIAKWSFNWKGNLTEADILTTAGCISAISYCLMALTQKGDTIVVESPCFYGILQLAKSLGLKILELPTSPQTGIDLAALKKTIAKTKISACLVVSNFSNPFGSLMPDEHKKELVQLLSNANIPIIEDDIYGDLYFGNKRPVCCKSFDENGMVLLCSSFSKTLAPAYRVGWVAPGKFMQQLTKMKLYHSLGNTPVSHEVIANFLESGRYEAHLRKLRNTLHTNYLQYVRVINDHFPAETKISRPQGGLSLWIELPQHIDTIELYNIAVKQKITFSPGSMFSQFKQFTNCMRLSYGLEWNEKTSNGLQLLGKLASKYK